MIYKTTEDIKAAKFLLSPPGNTLLETIKAIGISQRELASRMGRPIKTINEIIQGKAAILPETAIQLERVINISSEFWLEREQNYRLEVAEIQEAERLLETKAWLHNFPLKKMKEFNWLNYESNDSLEQYNSLLSFLSVSNKDAYYKNYNLEGEMIHCRMTKNSAKSPYSVNVWLRQGVIQSKELPSITYDSNKFKSNLDKIKELMITQPDSFFETLQRFCLEAGVKVVYTPCLPKTKLHGATRWLNGVPIIQLSNQYQRNDIFWFTFFHEAGHILKHGKKDLFIEGLEYTESGKQKEAEADSFAMKYTFPEKDEKELLENIKTADDQIEYINSYASSINTHPALIIGRLAKRNIIHVSKGWKYGFYKKIDLAAS